MFLYSFVSNSFYGINGTFFALIYLTISLTNFGFEQTLLPFFSTFSKNKQQFIQILHLFFLRIFSVAIISTGFYFVIFQLYPLFFQEYFAGCTPQLLSILIVIFFVESIKKSLNAMMQLAFLNKQIAYAELGMLVSYIIIVWSYYALYKTVTLMSLFFPLLATSFIEFLVLAYCFYQFYTQLPAAKIYQPISIENFYKQRFYNYINQVTKTAFSPNCMMLILVYMFGFSHAGIVKFLTNVITLAYTFLNKTIGITSGAAFSAMSKTSSKELRILFLKITNRYFQFLYGMGIVVLITLFYAWKIKLTMTTIMAVQILSFFAVNFLEYLTLTYEQLFFAKQSAGILAIINGMSIISLIPLFFYHQSINNFILMPLLGIKFLALAAITFFAHFYWKIKPTFKISNYVLIVSVALSAILCLIM